MEIRNWNGSKEAYNYRDKLTEAQVGGVRDMSH